MASTNWLTSEMNEALDIFPVSQTAAEARFAQAFDGISDAHATAILERTSQQLQTVVSSILKYGKTSVYDDDIEDIVAYDEDGVRLYDDEELIMFRRGALRDLIALKLKGRGYEVTRRRDGRPRLVVSIA